MAAESGAASPGSERGPRRSRAGAEILRVGGGRGPGPRWGSPGAPGNFARSRSPLGRLSPGPRPNQTWEKGVAVPRNFLGRDAGGRAVPGPRAGEFEDTGLGGTWGVLGGGSDLPGGNLAGRMDPFKWNLGVHI